MGDALAVASRSTAAGKEPSDGAAGRPRTDDLPVSGRQRRRLRRILVALGIATAVVAAIWIGAKTFVPPLLRRTVERLASQALGREVNIAGPFNLSFSLAPRVTAADLRLANAPWGSEPWMLRVGRATVVVDLLSLRSGPPLVRDVEIENARLLLEADGAGGGNWVFASEPASSAPHTERPKGPPVAFERVAIRGLEVAFRSRPNAEPVALGVREIEARLEAATRMIDLHGAGQFNQSHWEISGRFGTLENLFEGRDLEFALDSRIEASRLEARGRIRDPRVLREAELEVSAEGADIAGALKTFGLRSPLNGPFQLHGRFTPAKDGIGADVSAMVGAVAAKAQGVLEHLSLDAFRLDVEATGPDASLVGSWFDVEGIPPQPFVVSGQVRLKGGRFYLERIRTRVGPTSLLVTGVLGKPPSLIGTELTVRATGPDLSHLSKLTTLPLPTGRFQVAGRFLRRANDLAIDAVELQFRQTVIHAGGSLGEPPHFAKLHLTADVSGPDLAVFSRLATVKLPHAPFTVGGGVARVEGALDLEGVEGRVGDGTLSGRGRVVFAKRLEGTTFQVRVAGPDLAKSASLVGFRGVPAEPFEVEGHLRVAPGRYELEDVKGSVGRVSVAVNGQIGARTALQGTSLSCRARGPALSDLAAWGLPPKLPAEPFSVAGRLQIDSGVYQAQGVVAKVGSDRMNLDGTLGALPDLSRLDLVVDAAGPSLAGLGRFLPALGLEPSTRIPDAAYEMSGQVQHSPAGYELHQVRLKAAQTELRVDGTVGSGRDMAGTNIQFRAEAPDTSLLSNVAHTPLPGGPFEAHGRLARADKGFLLDNVAVSVGDLHTEVSGTLGAPPKLRETELHFKASGPDLSATLRPIGVSRAPAAAFEVSTDLAGSVERLSSKGLVARLGGNDVEGSLQIRLEDKPAVDAELRSRRLDVGELLGEVSAQPAALEMPAASATKTATSETLAAPATESAASETPTAPATETATSETPDAPATESERKRLIPDYPLELGALRSFDSKLNLHVAELLIPGRHLRDVVVTGEVRDGGVRLNRVEGSRLEGGHVSGALELEPSGRGYRVAAQGRFVDVRLGASGASREKEPPFDVEFQLKGEGRSLREIAASLDGSVQMTVGPGQFSNAYGWMSTGVLTTLLDALNPFRKSSPYTNFECGIALATFERGKASVEPLTARTDKLTVVGNGKVDFNTENIDLDWTIKPRTGIGLSAGSVANPYVKLGGTLTSPKIEVKPLDAAVSTGAAVATLGLSILAQGLYDRITAEENVCINALVKPTQTAQDNPDEGAVR